MTDITTIFPDIFKKQKFKCRSPQLRRINNHIGSLNPSVIVMPYMDSGKIHQGYTTFFHDTSAVFGGIKSTNPFNNPYATILYHQALLLDDEYSSISQQFGLNMTRTETATNDTTYVRAINDYTTSSHEIFAQLNGKNPKTMNVVTIKECPFTNFDSIDNMVIQELSSRGFERIYDTDIVFHDDLYKDDDEYDDYTVYSQSINVFSDGENKICLEYLGTPKLTTITVFSNEDVICKEIVEHIKVNRIKFRTYKSKVKERTFYTISATQRGFELEDLDIKVSHTDAMILENYNDDFENADKTIKTCIDENKKGLVLLHGLPGSGKTSYIKHLITRSSDRKIVYIPAHLATAIASPNFISFVKNELSNSVLVIEDAEQVLISRESNESVKEAVSNILNMTDGILADALNILIVCTFNTDMKYIDVALTRRGRLMLQYEFKKLNKEKSTNIMQKLYGIDAAEPMTLADIFNYEYDLIKPTEPQKVAFGFGR